MSLAVGTKAPDFTLSTKTADGPKQIKLSDNFGKKSSNAFPFPKFLLSLICFGPSAVFVDNVKSGALVPTASGISESSVCDFGAKIQYRFGIQRVKGDREALKR